MKVPKSKVQRLIDRLDKLIDFVQNAEKDYKSYLEAVHPEYEKSARNLIHYRTVRSKDFTEIQKDLRSLGLSSMARAEDHVLASLQLTRSVLKGMITSKPVEFDRCFLSIKKGQKLVRSHSKALLGYRSKGRRVRIMVTLSTEAAHDYKLVHALVESGMNSARINCAHDGPEVWEAMIANVRRASKSLRRNVKICMDLGGPKIRTGPMRPGPKITTFPPKRDTLGRVVGPAIVHLIAEWPGVDGDARPIPLPADFLDSLTAGEKLSFIDSRGKNRRLHVVERMESGWIAHSYTRPYIQTGTIFYRADNQGQAPVGEIPPVEEKMHLKPGDTLVLHRDTCDGEPAEIDDEGNVLQPAHISCTAPEIFDEVKQGERILFDDGKIEGIVASVVPGAALHVEIVHTRLGGQKLGQIKVSTCRTAISVCEA